MYHRAPIFVEELHDICSLIRARLDGSEIPNIEIINAFSAQKKRERHGYFYIIESDVRCIFGVSTLPNHAPVETEIGIILAGIFLKLEHVLQRLEAYIKWLEGIENSILDEKLYLLKICKIEYKGKEKSVNEVERLNSGKIVFLEESSTGHYFADCRVSVGFGDYSAIRLLSESEKNMYLSRTLNLKSYM